MTKVFIKKILAKAGGTVALSKKLRITPQAISQWRKRVPTRHVIALEEITGIPREKLRPDIYALRNFHPCKYQHPTSQTEKETRV